MKARELIQILEEHPDYEIVMIYYPMMRGLRGWGAWKREEVDMSIYVENEVFYIEGIASH